MKKTPQQVYEDTASPGDVFAQLRDNSIVQLYPAVAPWQGGIQTFTVTTDFTMSGSDENNEILIFSGTGGTYHVTLPNPASNAAAHTHYIEVSDMDIVFQCGTGATKLTLAADGKTKKGTMYVAPNVVAGNVKLIEV